MAVNMTREELIKLIKPYVDIKINCKYLVYFKEAPTNKDLSMHVTNGSNVWSKRLDEEFLASTLGGDTKDYLGTLVSSIKTDSFDLNTLVDVNNQNKADLIEFKATKANNKGEYRIVLDQSTSGSIEIKSLLFALSERCVRLEAELTKVQNSRAVIEEVSSSPAKKQTTQEAPSSLKKFNISSNHQPVIRKHGMSLINPMSKRKKTPKGVKFDEDEDNNEDEYVNVDECSSESNDSTSTAANKKFVRNISNVSSQSTQND